MPEWKTIYNLDGTDDNGDEISCVIEVYTDNAVFVTLGTLAEYGWKIHVDGADARHNYTPVKPSTAEIAVWDTGSIESYLTNVEARNHRCNLFRDGNRVWTGYLKPRTYRNEPCTWKDITYFEAVDGLSLLKHIPYADSAGDPYEGWASVHDIVRTIFNKLDMDANLVEFCNWHMPDTSGDVLKAYGLQQEGMVDRDGFPISCEQALRDICFALNLQCVQSYFGFNVDTAWGIIQRQMNVPTGGLENSPGFAYQLDGTLLIYLLGDFDIEKTEDEDRRLKMAPDRQPNRPALDGVSVAFDNINMVPLIRNPNFGTRTSYIARYGENLGNWQLVFGEGRPTGWIYWIFYGFRPPTILPPDDWHIVVLAGGGHTITVVSAGPNGENAASLAIATGGPADTGDAHGDYFKYADRYLTNYQSVTPRGRIFQGGTGIQIRASIGTYVKTDGTGSRFDVFPVHLRVILKSLDGGSDYWLARDYTWTESALETLWFLELEDGVLGDEWFFYNFLSADTPEGTFQLVVELFNAVDNTGSSVAESHYWTNIIAELVLDDIPSPKAKAVSSFYPDRQNLLKRNVRLPVGTVELLDAPGCLTRWATDHPEPIKDLKVGEYDTEPPTGVSLEEMNATALIKQQGKQIKGRVIDYYFRQFGIVYPHETLVIGDERYEIVRCTYNGARARMENVELVQLVADDEDPDIEVVRVP